MKFSSFFLSRFRWINVPGMALLAVLQRAPVVRVAAVAEQIFTGSPIGAVLKMAAAAAASLGAIQTLAGATQWVLNPGGTQSGQTPTVNESGTAGAGFTLGYTVTGAQTPAGSFRIAGLPPGLSIPGMNSSGILNASSGVITGSPTTAGTYSTTIRAYEFNNGTGDAWGPITLRFTIAAGAAVAPIITTQPASQTVNAGATVTFTVVATGSPVPTYVWRKNGTDVSGGTNASLTLPAVTAADAGSYSVVVTNVAGIVTSSTATLTVNGVGTVPVFTTQPAPATVATGSTVVFSAAATGATGFQWQRNGSPIAGATSSMLVVTGTDVAPAAFSVVAANAAGSTASNAANLAVVSTTDVGRLINLSILTSLATGETMTMGTVLGGAGTSGTKPLLARAAGPSLTQLGVTGVLPDPTMTVVNTSTGTPVATNNNWGGDPALSAAFTQVGAFPYISTTSSDAAVFRGGTLSLPPANYTVQVSDVTGTPGTVIAELYDATATGTFTATTPRLINVSVLKTIPTGGSLTAGFFVGGTTARTVLIRAIGPALGLPPFNLSGVMPDPQLTLFNNAQQPIAANNDWGGDPAITTTGGRVGAFAVADVASKDAMLLVTLAPGASYTAQVNPAAGTAGGTAIVEVYEVP